jgi:hypothetical protein
MHYYKLYGLVFASEMAMPFIPTIEYNKKPDVVVQFGKVPVALENVKNKGVLFQTSDNEFIFRIDGKANYYLKNGGQVWVEKHPRASDKDVYTFFAGTVLGALLQQRGILAMHGSAVGYPGGSVIFSGSTGVGKTGLAFFHHRKHYPVITDDVAIVDEKDGCFWLTPGPRYMKIWENVLVLNGLKIESFENLRENIRKFIVPLPGHEIVQSLKCIFIIRQVNRQVLEFTKIKGIEKFQMLRRNVYKTQFLLHTSHEAGAFEKISRLAQSVDVYLVERCSNLYFEKEMEEKVKSILNES